MTTNAIITEDAIKGLISAWFRNLDVHAPIEEILPLLADAGLHMIFPERALEGLDDFKIWYAGGKYLDGSSTAGIINTFFDGHHILQQVKARILVDKAIIDVFVGWQASWWEAPAARSKRTLLDSTQQLEIRPSSKNIYGLEILKCNAILNPLRYAPGCAWLAI